MSRRVKLPVAGASPLMEVRKQEAAFYASYSAMPLSALAEEVRRDRLLSANGKTSISLDLPVGHTCVPTEACEALCYAIRAGAPARWALSLQKRIRNLAFIERAPAIAVAEQLEYEHLRAARYFRDERGVELDFLRVNGTGDLVAPLVDAVNLLATRNPSLRVWLVTRRFEFAAEIARHENIFLQLSLDATTRATDHALASELLRMHPRTYTSFLRRSASDDPGDATIVFPAKRTDGIPRTPRDCPADTGQLPLNNIGGVGGTACARCRRCFRDRVVEVQRADTAVNTVPGRRRVDAAR